MKVLARVFEMIGMCCMLFLCGIADTTSFYAVFAIIAVMAISFYVGIKLDDEFTESENIF